MKRKRNMPTFRQWQEIRLILGNGWGEAEFGAECPADNRRYRKSIRAFDEWLQDRYKVKFNYPLPT